MDRGTTSATTDQSGHYFFESGLPANEWLVLEAYDDRYYTTGVTYQADNQPDPTTILGQGVDVSVLPVIGLSAARSTGVFTPTTHGHQRHRSRRTAGSSASSATTRPATSSTRGTRRPRTGSPESRA